MGTNDAKVKEVLRKAKVAEQAAAKQAEKQVMIEKAINLKLMCDYVVSCSYGDIVLIIGMLHDYVGQLDEVKGSDITYRAYYRNKFLSIADRLAGQIGYDYDAAVEKCKKKHDKEDKDDVGEEAMVLAYKKSIREAERRSAENEGRVDT